MVGQHWLKMKEKIGPHACLRVNNHSFLWWAKPHNNKPIMPCMYMHCEHPLMTEQNVVEACVMEYMRMLKKDMCAVPVSLYTRLQLHLSSIIDSSLGLKEIEILINFTSIIWAPP